METLTRVTDPYFGQYYRLYIMPGVVWYVGPCAKRTLRTGYLYTSGPIAQTANVTEKECINRGVTGNISGIVASYANHVSRVDDDYWEYSRDIGGGFIYLFKCSMLVDESSSSVKLTCRVDRQCFYKGQPHPALDRWAKKVLLFSRRTDALTGNQSCTYSSTTSREGTLVAGAPDVASVSCPYGTAGTTLGPSLTEARFWLNETLGLRSRPREEEWAARNEAIYRALDSVQVTDMSWLENFQDAAAPLDSIRGLAKAFSSGPWWVRSVKSMASLHLFWKFVVETGIADSTEVSRLIRFLRRGRMLDGRGPFADMIGRGSSSFTCSGVGYTEEQEWHAKVVLSPGWGPFSTMAQMQLLGLLPTAGNIWDLLPFSFVVDWCIPVGKMLSRGDDIAATLHLPLKHIVVGQKCTITYSKRWLAPDGHQLDANLTESIYRRRVLHSFPMTSLGRLSFRDPRKHAVTGLALVVQQALR